MIRDLLHRLFGCRHPHMVCERRTRYGASILHYACPICGFATPIIQRSESETRAMFGVPPREGNHDSQG